MGTIAAGVAAAGVFVLTLSLLGRAGVAPPAASPGAAGEVGPVAATSTGDLAAGAGVGPSPGGPDLDSAPREGTAAAGGRAQPTSDAEAAAGGADPTGAAGSAVDAAAPVEVDWWAVLDDLDERRAQAVARRDRQRVDSYAAAGSPFQAAEAQLLNQLAEDGLIPRGWRTSIIAVEGLDGRHATGSGGASVTVVVVDERSAFELVDASGQVVRRVPASGKRRWRVTLTWSGASGGSAGEDPGLADARSAVADDLAVGAPASTEVPDPDPDQGPGASEPSPGRAPATGLGPAGPGAAGPGAAAWRISSVARVS